MLVCSFNLISKLSINNLNFGPINTLYSLPSFCAFNSRGHMQYLHFVDIGSSMAYSLHKKKTKMKQIKPNHNNQMLEKIKVTLKNEK